MNNINIPIEIVNKILIMRPIHSNAILIKNFFIEIKERIFKRDLEMFNDYEGEWWNISSDV
jgi:hypothetical protein